MKNSRVAVAVRKLLVGSAAILSIGAAYAAEPADEELGEVVVTGSRLRGATAPVGSSIIELDRKEIEISGAATTDRMLQDLPQVFDLGVSENSRAQGGGAGNIVYANSVNLRGIGPNATLTLLDGHRMTSNSRSVNPSVIPMLGLERVEVVADGASAIYGSDAIAGVVNLIPRRNLDGFEGSARYGQSEDGDFDEYQLGVAGGKIWDSGQVMVAYEHVYRSNLNGDDRDFFTGDQRPFGGRDYRVTTCNPGTITAGGVTYAIPAGGVTPGTASSLVAGTSNKCNQIIGQDLFPESSYDSVNSTFNQNIGDLVTVFADGFYSNRDYTRLPAQAFATLTVPNTNAFYVAPPGFGGTSTIVGYNFQDDLPINAQTGYTQSWEVTPGVRVKLPHDWQAEALVTYGRTHDEANTYGGLNTAATGTLNAALASNNPATAFDPYGLHRTSAATLALIANQIFLAPTKVEFTGYEARVNGGLFNLPGGEVKMAAGYEGQDINVDLGSARGNPTVPITYRSFSRRVDSFYGELLLPLVGSGNQMTGLYKLDVDVAVRYDDYSDVGSTTNPKYGLNWSPIQQLTVRGSYGTSFRAPQIAEIYGNSNNLFQQNYQNPAGGAPLPGSALSGANLELKPETATTWSVGVDWNALENLRFSVTRWDVNYKNQVAAQLSNLTILSQESQFAGTGVILHGTAARDRVLELIAAGIAPVGPYPGGNPNNVNLFIDGRNLNLGKSATTGYDFAANYHLGTDSAGSFNFNLSATYISDYSVAITASAPPVDKLNTIFNPLKFKARAAIDWNLQPFRVRLAATHVDSYTNNAITPAESVSSYTPVDIAGYWDIGDPQSSSFIGSGLTVGLEVNNLLDTGPPYVNLAPNGNGSGGYDATAASPIGRQYALNLRKKW
jgi:iron complex outermembrane receptor protein